MFKAAARFRLSSAPVEVEPREPRSETPQSIYVLFTSVDDTRKAMENACLFSRLFNYEITVLAVLRVPFSLPLEEPQVSLEVLADRLKEIAREFPQIARVSICLCRDELDALKKVVRGHCPVVMIVPKTLWPSRQRRLAQKLRHAGRRVIGVETE